MKKTTKTLLLFIALSGAFALWQEDVRPALVLLPILILGQMAAVWLRDQVRR